MFAEIAYAAEAARAAESESSGVLGSLGIDLKIFIAQLVNFGIVLFVLWKWAWKPILRTLDAREKKIGESIIRAQKIEEEMKALDSKKSALLSVAEAESQKILDSAKSSAEEFRKEKLEETKKELEHLILKGKAALAAERERMVREAKADLAEIVALAAEKVLEEKIDAKADDKLIKKVLAQI